MPDVTRRAYSADEHVRWLRSTPAFRELLEAKAGRLWAPRRHGQPWVELGLYELGALASDRERAADLVGALTDPKKSALAAVLPRSLRHVLGVLALGERVSIEIPGGGGRLQAVSRDELQGLCARRLDPTVALTVAERARLHRLLGRIDPGAPAELVAGTRDGRVRGGVSLGVGDPVGLHATAALHGHLIAGPSAAVLPNVGYVKMVWPHEVRVALSGTPFDVDITGP